MMESRTIERTGFDTAAAAGQDGSSAELRPLCWAGIAARLAAAHELRGLLRAAAANGGFVTDDTGADLTPCDQK